MTMDVVSSLRQILSSPPGSFLAPPPPPNPRGYLDAANLAHCDVGAPIPNRGPVTDHSWRLEGAKPDNENPESPTFIRSLPAIQDLVRSCTECLREWTDGLLGLVRRGSKVYLRGESGWNGEDRALLDETRIVIQGVWSDELRKIEAFVEARMRYDEGVAIDRDVKKLRYLERSKLVEVLRRLENAEI